MYVASPSVARSSPATEVNHGCHQEGEFVEGEGERGEEEVRPLLARVRADAREEAGCEGELQAEELTRS
jgi:hypothetical protein